MSKYLPEPWRWAAGDERPYMGGVIADRNGQPCVILRGNYNFNDYKDNEKRAVSCVNALTGIDDPAAFVEAVKELVSVTGRGPIDEPLEHAKNIAVAIDKIRNHLKESPCD